MVFSSEIQVGKKWIKRPVFSVVWRHWKEPSFSPDPSEIERLQLQKLKPRSLSINLLNGSIPLTKLTNR